MLFCNKYEFFLLFVVFHIIVCFKMNLLVFFFRLNAALPLSVALCFLPADWSAYPIKDGAEDYETTRCDCEGQTQETCLVFTRSMESVLETVPNSAPFF